MLQRGESTLPEVSQHGQTASLSSAGLALLLAELAASPRGTRLAVSAPQAPQRLPQQQPKQRSVRCGLGPAKDTRVPFPDAPPCLSALFQLYRVLLRQDSQHTPWVGTKPDRLVSESSIVTEDPLRAAISRRGIGKGVSRGSCFSEVGK